MNKTSQNPKPYIMQEKLDVMTLLVNERNVDQVLLEFKEYATEVDADFVRKVSPEFPLICLLTAGFRVHMMSDLWLFITIRIHKHRP